MNQEKMEAAYVAAHAAIIGLIEDIAEGVGNIPEPSRANWGHVGSLGSLIHDLESAKTKITELTQ